MAPFGIALLGMDHWYTAFLVADSTATSAHTPLVGIGEADAARRTELTARYPDAFVTNNVDGLLADPAVMLVAICASTDQAPALAKRALNAGTHVLCVKPPAMTLAHLDEVLALAQEKSLFFGSFEGMQRLNPRATVLREIVQSGVLGVPMSYYQVGHGGLPAPWRGGQSGEPSWWLDPTRAPMGAWADHAIYAIDLARFVFGGTVSVVGSLIEKRRHTHLPLEDYGIALMRLQTPEGVSVSLMIEDTWSAEPGGGVHRYEIIGSRGSVRLDGGEWVVRTGSEEIRHTIPEAPFFDFNTLAEALTNGMPLPFDAADARANLTACLECYS